MRPRARHRVAAGVLLAAASGASFAQALPGGAIGPTRPAGGQGYAVAPGIRVSETISDNMLLAPKGQEHTGTLTEVAPSVRASFATGRAQGVVDYTMHALYRSVSDGNQATLRHSLNATGNTLLLGESFGIQGTASTFYVNNSLFGPLVANPTLTTVNTSRVTTVMVGPYLIGRLGSFANYAAQYSLTHVDTSANASGFLASNDRRVYLSLTNGPEFLRWGWSLYVDALRRDIPSAPTLDRRTAVGTAYYVFSPELRAGGSINYSFVEGIANSQGHTSGVGPGAFVDWSPNRRTTVRANWADNFYGTTQQLSVSHARERWTFGLNYTRALLSSNSAALLLISPGALFTGGGFSADLNPVYQQLSSQGLISSNTLLASGLVNDSLVRTRFLSMSLGYSAARASGVFTAFRSVRDSVLQQSLVGLSLDPLVSSTYGRYESIGLTATGRLTLTPRSSISLTAMHAANHSLDDARRTRMTSSTASFNTQITPRSTASLAIRRTVQSGDGGVVGYDENAVIGSFTATF